VTTALQEGSATQPSSAAGAGEGQGRRSAWHAWALLAVIVGASAGATVAATRRTSTTFDEITVVAAGTRGFHTRAFDLAPAHPPLTQYLYGLPVFLAEPNYPPDQAKAGKQPIGTYSPYLYARQFFWGSANDPEKLAFLGRLGGALCVVLLVLSVFLFARRRFGDAPALLAAWLVAFLPDVLAHGGVACNDLPLALTYFLAAWAIDAAVRCPTLVRGAVSGASVALAVGTKFSAIVLPAVAVLLLLMEAFALRERRWLPHAKLAVLAGTAAMYLALVAVYRGDFTLAEMRYGLDFTFRHVTRGHDTAPAYLLGRTSQTGWAYFFPLAFLYKTPAAFHLLLIAGLVGLSRSTRDVRLRWLFASPLRMPVVAGGVLLGALFASNLAIGFRHALPALPLLCVIAAVGVQRLWVTVGRVPRLALATLALWMAVSTLSFYPHFLAYTSEWGPGRDRGHELLLDSNLDWGQGLLDLRNWMRRNAVERVYLSYFGSALPAGYGIDYVALPSFFVLPPSPPPPQPPRYAVISATNLHGLYLPGDPLARFRDLVPDTVIAHTLLVYKVGQPTN